MDYMFTSPLLPECVVRMTQGSNNNIFMFPLCPPCLVFAIEQKKNPLYVSIWSRLEDTHIADTGLPESEKLEKKKIKQQHLRAF